MVSLFAVCSFLAGVRAQTNSLVSCPELGSTFECTASWFDSGWVAPLGTGACHPTPGEKYMEDRMFAAMSENNWKEAEVCGQCVEVLNKVNLKSVIVTIVDKCGGCGEDGVSLSKEAFDRISDGDDNSIDVIWKVVPCPVEGNIKYKFKEGSMEWWFGIQPVNSRYPIHRLEVKPFSDSLPYSSDEWTDFTRDDNGFFMKPSWEALKAPFALRLTATNDLVIEEPEVNEIKIHESDLITGTQQFDDCEEYYPRFA